MNKQSPGPTLRSGARPTSSRRAAFDDLIRRLDLVLALLVRQGPGETRERGISEQIWVLKSLGADTPVIASIVGKKSNFVSATVGKMPKGWPIKRGRSNSNAKA